MNQALLHSVAPILAAPWRQRRNVGSLWGLAAVVGLLALGPLAAFCWALFEQLGTRHGPAGSRAAAEVAADFRHLAANAGCWALAALALGWWAVTVSNLLEQNKPVLARLVPEHPARLRVALLVAWAAAAALVTLVLGVRFDVALATAAIATLALVFLAASVRWPLMWVLGCVAPLPVHWLQAWPGLSRAVDTVSMIWAAHGVEIFLALAVGSAVLLMALIQDGGKRHVASDDARSSRIRRFQMRASGAQPVAEGTRGHLDAVLTLPYYAVWRHTFSRRSTSPVFGRVMQALGPGVHWTSGFAAIVGMVIALAVVTLVLSAIGSVFAGANFAPDILAAVSVGMLPGLIAPALQVQARLHQSRREQALLVLLPGVPQGATLDRRLSWQLTLQFVAAWVGAVAVMAACMGVAEWLRPGVVRPELLRVRGLLMIATLPLVAFQWRPWARVAAPTSLNALAPVLVGGLLALVAWIGPLTGLVSPGAVATVSMVAAVAWCAWRWARMGGEPSAFPVGRLA